MVDIMRKKLPPRRLSIELLEPRCLFSTSTLCAQVKPNYETVASGVISALATSAVPTRYSGGSSLLTA